MLLLFVLLCLSFRVAAQVNTSRIDSLLEILNNPDNSYVLVGAHRGDWRNEPENSLAAIRNCIEMGIDMVEIDVRRTKDGHFILMHDETLDRTTTGKGYVKDWMLDSIKTLYLKNYYGNAAPRRVPTLEEALLLAKDKILIYLDKSPDLIREIYPILQRTGTTRQAFFYGYFTAQELQQRYGDLLDSIYYFPKVTDKTENIPTYIEDLEKTIQPLAYLPEFKSEESPAFRAIKILQAKGTSILVAPLYPSLCAGRLDDLAVDDPDAHWGWAIAQGANIFFTDRPALLLQYLRAKGLHN